MFGLDPHLVLIAATVTLAAGIIKGAIGFAMPMIMMSGLGSFLPAPVALALSILPMLVTNVQQATRQGPRAAWDSIRAYRWHIGMLGFFIFVSAPFARILPQPLMYLALGVPILGFALWQLSGRPLAVPGLPLIATIGIGSMIVLLGQGELREIVALCAVIAASILFYGAVRVRRRRA